MNPLQFIADAFGMIKELFGFANKKTELNNTPEMKKRDEAKKENNQDDIDVKNIEKRNLDDVRNSAS